MISSTSITHLTPSVTTSLYNVYDEWASPQLVETRELPESIELLYIQQSNISNNWGQMPPRVYKVVFSCVDGKWNKSEPIFGKIIPASKEYYEFDEE